MGKSKTNNTATYKMLVYKLVNKYGYNFEPINNFNFHVPANLEQILKDTIEILNKRR